MSGNEPGSWFDFARYAQKMNTLSDPNSSFSQTKILPISSREFNQKAKRPNYSFLASDKLKNDFGISLPNWKKVFLKLLGEMEKIRKGIILAGGLVRDFTL